MVLGRPCSRGMVGFQFSFCWARVMSGFLRVGSSFGRAL